MKVHPSPSSGGRGEPAAATCIWSRRLQPTSAENAALCAIANPRRGGNACRLCDAAFPGMRVAALGANCTLPRSCRCRPCGRHLLASPPMDSPLPGEARPACRRRRRDADDGAVSSRSRRPIRTACSSTGWAISTRCSSTTPRSPARALGITLTKRGKHLGADIPMCGVPIHAADQYLQKLIALGHRVAVCEQIEDPAEARKRGDKSVVRRDVIRLVTPGTLTEDALLDRRPQQLSSPRVARQRGGARRRRRFALAWIDISTGEFRVATSDRGAPRRRPRPHRPARGARRRAALRRCRPERRSGAASRRR